MNFLTWNYYRDQTFEDPPEDDPIAPPPAPQPVPVSKYQIKQAKKLESEYEKMMLAKEAAYKERLRREKLEQEQRERDEAERPTGKLLSIGFSASPFLRT